MSHARVYSRMLDDAHCDPEMESATPACSAQSDNYDAFRCRTNREGKDIQVAAKTKAIERFVDDTKRKCRYDDMWAAVETSLQQWRVRSY